MLYSILGIFLLILLSILTCDLVVRGNASGRTYDSVDSIPHNRVGLLLATSPITPGGAHNFYFDNRIKAAVELYNAGKIDVIIASGGDYTKTQKNGCDEPAAIRDSLVKYGVSPFCIELDYEGTRTLNSIAKLKESYGVDTVTLISQKYHNERAIYIADKYGITAVGYNAAPSPIRRNRIKNTLREYLARPKMFLDFLLGVKTTLKKETLSLPYDYVEDFGIPVYLNSVKGHIEEDSIVGNFTGLGIDTIYIDPTPLSELSPKELKRKKVMFDDELLEYAYVAKSNNPDIPEIVLFNPNGLVYEGDVDGDGKDEWGYLYEWMTSQWRQYRIYNYDSKTKTWRHLYYDIYDPDKVQLLSTPEYLRSSGVDIVGKGPRPGLIKINYSTLGSELEIRDTVVKPTYTPITEDTW